MHLSNTTYDIIGTMGAALLLLGFYRTSIGKWKNRSFLYELDNLFGAGFLMIYQFHLKAYISVVLNLIWVTVAFKGLTPFVERYFNSAQKKRTSR